MLGYEIVKTIGSGGMGLVYEAVERNIGRRAAVKVLLPEAAENPEVVARLKAEARAANAARHRGIIDIFGFSELPDGRQAIVMEFLDGTPLDEELRRLAEAGRRMPPLEVLQVLDEVASVLSAAHGAGVVHRDLKPSNIFLVSQPDGTRVVKVLDFGIAKFDRNSSVKTQQNIALGTPDYMAPEQAAGKQASPSMDLYALGVMAFELLVGHPPFAHESIMALLLMHQQQPPPVPSSLVPSLPSIIDDFVLKLLAKRPQDRFDSADAVRARIRELRRDLADGTAMPTMPTMPGGPRLEAMGGGHGVRARAVKPPVLQPARPRAAAPTEVSLSSTQARSVRRSAWPVVALVGIVAVAVVAVAWVTSREAPNVVTPPVAAPPVVVQVEPAEPVPTPSPPEPTPPPTRSPEVAELAPLTPEVKKPPPTQVAPPQALGVALRRAALGKRLGRLGERLAQIEAEGASVDLVRQQVTALRNALRGSPDAKTLDQVEVTLERLEEETR